MTRRYRLWLCGDDPTFEVSECPGRHTPCPAGYIEWHAWAERMSRHHRQLRCRVCGLFAVWVTRRGKAACDAAECRVCWPPGTDDGPSLDLAD